MEKQNKKWFYLIPLFILVLLGFAYFTGMLGVVNKQSVAPSSTFTPVYCNDPTSLCCVKTETTGSGSLSATNSWLCDSKLKCSISVSSQGWVYSGSKNCRIVQDFSTLFIKQYRCDDESILKNGNTGQTLTNVDISSNFQVYSDRSESFSFVKQGQKLVTNLGATVSSDSCAFTVSSGQKITKSDGTDLGISYTVPAGSGVGTLDSCILSWVAGSRHICGNLEEKCSSDSDCIGHTYGSKECTQRTLQTYGCTQLNNPSNVQNGFLGQNTGDLYSTTLKSGQPSNAISGVTSRCEIKSATTVQCCGDSDCGSGAVCDTSTFTCKAPATVQCTSNTQCGVSTQCDYVSKQLKTPICKSGGSCGYSTKSVECCSEGDCSSGSFCNADYKCEVSNPNIKVQCASAFECCVGDSQYTDRACPSGKFCNNHVCMTQAGCTKDSDCLITQECKSGECVAKTQTCSDLFAGLVPSTGLVTESSCGFLGARCWFGSPLVTTSCGHDWTLMFLIIGIVFILIIGLIVFLKYFNKGKKGKK